MRDPLVEPAVGDVIEGREGDSVYRWTVYRVDGDAVHARVLVTHRDGTTDDDSTGRVDLEDWHDWSGWGDVHVVATVDGPVPPPRDPLVNPEPGDVVRAACDGAPGTIVVLDVAEGLIGYAVCWPGHRKAHVYEETLDEWRDWSAWADVAVLS